MKDVNLQIIFLIIFGLLLNFCEKKTSVSPPLSDYYFYGKALDSLFPSDKMVVLRDSVVDANGLEHQHKIRIYPNFNKALFPIQKDSLETNASVQTISLKKYHTVLEGSGLSWVNFYNAFPQAVGFVTLSKIYRQKEHSKAYFMKN